MYPDNIYQRPTLVEVNLNHLTHNLQQVRNRVGDAQVMAIVKANAYGHGLIRVAQHFEKQGVDQLGVAFLEEGIALRKAGIKLPILVMGGICAGQLEHFFDHDLEITVSSLDKLRLVEEAAQQKNKKAIIHLKIDTGMNRIGVQPRSAAALIDASLNSSHCVIKGVYSHLACADDPSNCMTTQQLILFNEVCELFTKHGAPMPIRHLANSGGILHFPETYLDMVRPGLMLYGVYPAFFAQHSLLLKPALTLKSKVVFFKVLTENQTVSYGATWKADKPARIVTVPIGYGDGYPRALSNVGEVLIRGQRFPIVGAVCMDQLMVNIGWQTAYNDDEVVLIGTQGDQTILVEELAQKAGTIAYELLTCLNERIPRVYC